MATTADTIEFLTEQLASLAGRIRTRKMFGEYALYCDEKVVGFVCDDQLFVKITPASRPFLDPSHDAPPYPGAKPYICVSPDLWEDSSWLADIINSTAVSLPMPKPKNARHQV